MPAHRRAPFAAVTLAGALALTACSSGAPGAVTDEETLPKAAELAEPTEPVTITWIDEENENVRIGDTIAAFEEAHPNITIDYQTVPHADYQTVLASRLETGDIDIVSVDQSVGPTYYANGWVQDLTPVFEDELDLLDQASVEGSTFDGKLINAPRQSDTTVLFYNKDVLDDAGIAYPSEDPADDPITWQQLRDNGAAAQAAGAAEWGVTWERIASRYYQWPIAESNGAGTGLDPDDSLAPRIDTPEAVEALQFYGDLYADGVSPRGDTTSIYTDLFASGQSAYHTGGAWDIDALNANAELNYGVARFPTFEGGIDASNSGGLALGLYPGSQQKEAALYVIRELVFDPEGGELRYNADASSPSANDAGKKIFWSAERFADPRAATLQAFVDYQLQEGVAKPVVLSLGSAELGSIVSQAIADIANGTSAAAALAEAQAEAERQFAKYRG